MSIDKSYIPAIITAVASLLGIIINIIINNFYRIIDKRQRMILLII